MATSGAIRRLAFFVSATSAVASCVSRLDDLQGTLEVDEQATTDEETSQPTTDQPTASSEPTSEGATETSSATPGATTPACNDGLLNSEGFCVPQVRCAPGTFVSEVDGMRVCSPCASGQFSNEYDTLQCQTWRDCEAGAYVVEPGTSTADRECEACPDGETSTSQNAGECSSASDCAAGTYKSYDACVPCSAGNYCSGKTANETPCESDAWDDDSDPATPCIVKTNCAPGQFVADEGTTVTDRSCDFCDEDTFSSEGNATGCSEWSACEAGSYVGLQGTSTSDRECTACPPETFSAESNLAGCEAWTTCAAPSEYVAAPPTAEQDRTCSACPAGYTASEDNAAACDVPIPANLVTNYDFESDATGWISWVGTVSLATARAYTGSRSLLVAGPGTGPAATNLDAVVEAGRTYNVSFWVNVGRVSSAQVNITRALTCGGSVTYLWLANNPSVPSGVWTQMLGTFSVPDTCSSPKLQVYAEGGGANVDLYVDNVSVTEAP